MNKSEMLEALDRGAKATHKYFSIDEWIQRHSRGHLIFEDGVICSDREFFTIRSDDSWDNGWHIIDGEVLRHD